MNQRPRAVSTTHDHAAVISLMLRAFLVMCCMAAMSIVALGQAPNFDPLAPGNKTPRPAVPRPGVAQPRGTTPVRPAPARPATPVKTEKKPNKKIPEEMKPRLEKVTTKDGVALQIGYFPSDRGKKAATVLLVHEWSGQTSPYLPLAYKLQEAGCAVALLDFRGHGRSRILGADGKPIEVDRATKRDMEAVVKLDMEAAKKFLRGENDAEKLNLNALAVIGIGEGSILAMNWTAMDWSWPSIGSRKQGQDVKAMILVSPMKSVNGVNGDLAARHQFVSRLPVMIVSGSSISENSEANRLAKMFERARVSGKFDNSQPLPVEPMRVRANLSGAELVRGGPGVIDNITKFIDQNVLEKMDMFEWVQRDEE